LERAHRSNRLKLQPALLLAIHHDSVQPKYLKTWRVGGKEELYCDLFRGFSLFVSQKNKKWEASLSIAREVGKSLRKARFERTLHHAEKIRGENRVMLDSLNGVYLFDDLTILKESEVPAILIECGVIVNREEERLLDKDEYRQRFAHAVATALQHLRPNRKIK
jgi:N-acetylmuramoyl-L-alanine amidase